MPAPEPQIPDRPRPTFLAGLKARLLVLTFCCVLPAFVVILCMGVALNREDTEEAKLDAQHFTALVSAGQDHVVNTSRTLLTRLAADPRVRGTQHDRCTDFLREALRLNPAYANFGVAAPNGDIVSSAIPLPRPVNDADRAWFRRAVETGAFANGSYKIGRLAGRPVINFAYPVRTPSGGLEGILFASVDVSWFEKIGDQGEVPSGSILAILDDEGAILASHPGRPRWIGMKAVEPSSMEKILTQHEGTSESRHLDGVMRLWSFSPLSNPSTPGGYVAVGVPAGLAFADADKVIKWASAAVLLISVLGLLAAWVGSDVFVMRKLRTLTNASGRLAAGDFRARSGLSEDAGEFGQLGRTLDHMASALERREREIKLAEVSLHETGSRLAAQHGVTNALADSASLTEAAPGVLAATCKAFEWQVGILWDVDPGVPALRCVGAWAEAGTDAGALVAASRRCTLGRGESVPGLVWASGQPYRAMEIEAAGADERIEAAAAAGLRSAFAFTISDGKEIVGVLEAFSRKHQDAHEVPAETVSTLTRQIGQFIIRRRSEKMQARLLGIIEATSDLVGFSGPDGRILYTNKAGRKMLGFSETEDITVTRIADYFDAKDGRMMAEVAIPTAVKEGVWVGETTMRRRDGQAVRVSQAVISHRSSGGELEYLSTIARDITEKVKLEEQFRQAQKMEAIGSLAGGIAHDFNNLLTAIQGFSDLALTRLDDKETLKRDIEEIRRAGVRAAALTRQLLIFSRQQVLEPRPLSMNMLVTELTKMLRRLIGEDIDLTISCGEPAATIFADPGQIEQVIINLVVNARDAMPEGGQIVVETSNLEVDETYAGMRPGLKPGSYVMLAVSDNGTGMDTATQARIFEPFFTTKEPGKGTGMGLATVYGIVKQCEGDVHVYSELGEGTTFKILLPRVAGAPDERRAGAEGGLERGTETILVVEDEEAVRSLVRSSLSLCGYVVHEARDGAEAMAVQAAVEGPIHLVICDMVMPLMNGPEVVTRLSYSRPESKVLFMSGYAEKSVLRRGLSQNAAFLHKPFGMETLARKVREVLDGAGAGLREEKSSPAPSGPRTSA